MATTMKKSEIQATAKANIIAEIIPDTARQIGAATYAMPTEVDGITCWVKIALTCGNPIGTEKVPAFDIEQACADWEKVKAEKEQAAAEKAAEKERCAAERAAEKERKAAKAKAREQAAAEKAAEKERKAQAKAAKEKK